MLRGEKFVRDKSHLFGNLIKLGRIVRQTKDTPTLTSIYLQEGPIQNDEKQRSARGLSANYSEGLAAILFKSLGATWRLPLPFKPDTLV